ncbi:hypothetical protein [Herbaspirillum huttiense]|uniref:Uncharacterized protein n=2 Tax=Herbaspirillum huttiense TaxID=863372 RepID=A0AAJ2H5L9_9BURK|nr:hypothetical protein [Herbaspirillum huttiense]MDR9837234.1 hypothetical protein [Herbaspirillum huttiense]
MTMQSVAVTSRQTSAIKPGNSVKVNRSLTQAEARGAKPKFVVPVTQSQQDIAKTTAPPSAIAASTARARCPGQYKGLTVDRFLTLADATAKLLQRR